MANELKFKSNVSITGNLNAGSFSIDKYTENNLPTTDVIDGALIYNSDKDSLLIWDEVNTNWDDVLPAITGGTVQGKDGSGYDIQPTSQPPLSGGNVVGDSRNATAVDLQMTRSASDQVAKGGRSAIIGGGDNKAEGINSGVYCGFGNFAEENYATCIGGQDNQALGIQSSTLGGYANVASGEKSIALGGANSVADGTSSLVAGRYADVGGFVGARVFADSTVNPITALQAHEFAVQASAFTVTGKAGIGTQTPFAQLEVDGNIRNTDFISTQPYDNTAKAVLKPTGGIELARTNGDPFIDFKYALDSDYDVRIKAINNGLAFEVGGEGSITNNALVIKQDGRIGISTLNPLNEAKLNIVNGNIALTTTTNNGNSGFITQDGTGTVAGEDTGIGLCANVDRLTTSSPPGIGADLFVNDNGATIARGKLYARQDVEITGQIQISGGNPGPNKVLTCDAAGVATWEAGGGTGASLINLQTLYVSKDGDDANGGTNIGEPKLTISSAISAAQSEQSNGDPSYTIQVLDDGIYDEQIILTRSLNLYAPFATIAGQIKIGVNCRVKVDKHYWPTTSSSPTNNSLLLSEDTIYSTSTNIPNSYYESNLIELREIDGTWARYATAVKMDPLVNYNNNLHVKIGKMRISEQSKGLTTTSFTQFLYFDINSIELCETNAIGIYTGSDVTGGAQYIGKIREIVSKGGINHIGIYVITSSNAIVNVKINKIFISGGSSAYSYRILDAFAGNPDSGELYIDCNNIRAGARQGTPAYENSDLSSSGKTALSGGTGNATSTELFINGLSGQRININTDTTVMFSAMVAARSSSESAGYKIEGVIKNDGGTTSLVGTAIKTVFAEEDTSWDCTVSADNTNDALTFIVTGDATDDVDWVIDVDITKVTN
jgi:hypothetical protein